MHAAMKGTEAADRRLVLVSAWLRAMATGLAGLLMDRTTLATPPKEVGFQHA